MSRPRVTSTRKGLISRKIPGAHTVGAHTGKTPKSEPDTKRQEPGPDMRSQEPGPDTKSQGPEPGNTPAARLSAADSNNNCHHPLTRLSGTRPASSSETTPAR